MGRRVICLIGLARSGKDTTADFLLNEFGFQHRASFAHPLKQAAKQLFGLTEVEVQGTNGYDREQPHPFWGRSVRDLLQTFGTESVRDIFGEDHWVKLMDKRLNEIQKDWGGDIIITDARFDNEVDMLVAKYGAIVIGLVRSGEDRPDVRPHVSEEMAAERLDSVSDFVIQAHNVNELHTQLTSIMKEINAETRV